MRTVVFCVILALMAAGRTAGQNFQWAAALGGTSTEEGVSIATDKIGNVYTTGVFYGSADFDPGPSNQILVSSGMGDVFVSKLNSSGSFAWANRIGGPGSDMGFAITTDPNGNVFVAGLFSDTVDFDPGPGTFTLASASSFHLNTFIVKLSPWGSLLWAKCLNYVAAGSVFSIETNSAGDCFVFGQFNAATDFDPGPGIHIVTPQSADTYVLKLSSAGNFVWVRTFGGANNSVCSGRAMKLDKAGNIYSTGVFMGVVDFDPGTATMNLTASGQFDAFVSKLNPAGNLVWAHRMGSTGTITSSTYGEAIAVDTALNVYVSGIYTGTADFDPGPAVTTFPYNSGHDLFIVKFDSAGLFSWARNVSGPGNEGPQSATVDHAGNIHIAGWFTDSADFDPGTQTVQLTSAGNLDLFAMMLTPAGDLCSAFAIGGTSQEMTNSIFAGDDGALHITGGFYSTGVDFDTGPGTKILSSNNSSGDVFILKYQYLGALGVIDGPQSACNVTQVTYSVAPVTGATGYIWQLPPGTSFTAAANAVTVSAAGGSITGNISVTATTTCGNGVTSALNIFLHPSLCVGLAEMPAAGLEIIPNPNDGTFETEVPEEATMKVFRLDGTLATAFPIHPGRNRVDLTALPPGLYVYEIQMASGRATGKFIRR